MIFFIRTGRKDWKLVSGGFFVLLSNKKMKPQEILDVYFDRTQIEAVFKSSKTFLGLLPLSKWTDTTVRGKILNDIISTIVYLTISKKRNKKTPINRMIGKCHSLMCFINSRGRISIQTANKQKRECYQELDIALEKDKYKQSVLGNLM